MSTFTKVTEIRGRFVREITGVDVIVPPENTIDGGIALCNCVPEEGDTGNVEPGTPGPLGRWRITVEFTPEPVST